MTPKIPAQVSIKELEDSMRETQDQLEKHNAMMTEQMIKWKAHYARLLAKLQEDAAALAALKGGVDENGDAFSSIGEQTALAKLGDVIPGAAEFEATPASGAGAGAGALPPKAVEGAKGGSMGSGKPEDVATKPEDAAGDVKDGSKGGKDGKGGAGGSSRNEAAATAKDKPLLHPAQKPTNSDKRPINMGKTFSKDLSSLSKPAIIVMSSYAFLDRGATYGILAGKKVENNMEVHQAYPVGPLPESDCIDSKDEEVIKKIQMEIRERNLTAIGWYACNTGRKDPSNLDLFNYARIFRALDLAASTKFMGLMVTLQPEVLEACTDLRAFLGQVILPDKDTVIKYHEIAKHVQVERLAIFNIVADEVNTITSISRLKEIAEDLPEDSPKPDDTTPDVITAICTAFQKKITRTNEVFFNSDTNPRLGKFFTNIFRDVLNPLSNKKTSGAALSPPAAKRPKHAT